jgi:hypothetical protein
MEVLQTTICTPRSGEESAETSDGGEFCPAT